MYEYTVFRSYNQKSFRVFDVGKISKSVIQTEQTMLNHLYVNLQSIYGVPTNYALCRAVGDIRICKTWLFPRKVYNLKRFYWCSWLYFRKCNFISSIYLFMWQLTVLLFWISYDWKHSGGNWDLGVLFLVWFVFIHSQDRVYIVVCYLYFCAVLYSNLLQVESCYSFVNIFINQLNLERCSIVKIVT